MQGTALMEEDRSGKGRTKVRVKGHRDGKGGGRRIWKRKTQEKKGEETRQWQNSCCQFFPPRTASAPRLHLQWLPLQR